MNSIIHKAPVLHKFVSSILEKPIKGKQLIHNTKRVLADTLGTAHVGAETKAIKSAFDTFNSKFGTGKSSVWGNNYKTDISTAVFLNALAISSSEFDEGHRKAAGHPASVVVPVAMMLGAELKKSDDEILKSIIIGYEAGTCFSYARIPSKVETWSTGRWGGIAAAATAGYLLGLDTVRFMHAISLGYILSPGMQGGSSDVSTGSMAKEGVAWAAQSGLQGALLANNGFTGPFLFIDAYDEIDKQKLMENESGAWLISSNYFKPYACCRWLHTAVSLALEVQKEYALMPGDIKNIEVRIFSRALKLIESKYPENSIQAQFHLPFTIAAALIYGELLPGSFENLHLQDEGIRLMIDKINLVADQHFDDDFPRKLGSEVTIIRNDGQTVRAWADAAPWDADRHPSDEELFQKFERLSGADAKKRWEEIFNK